MAKLWDKGYDLDSTMEAFTVGQDYLLDRALIEPDILGSIAHAQMLRSIGILSDEEFEHLRVELVEILSRAERGAFEIAREDEDVHTAVENALTQTLGEAGRKIHTARSRNDQVLVDLRMYTRTRLLEIEANLLETAGALTAFAAEHQAVPMPGRTHMQLAMPSSVGLWAAAFAEALLDDLELLKTAYRLNNRCPLGAAASYGVPLPIDRRMVSELLGFDAVQNNVLYTNNSRGKIETVVLFALAQATEDLSRLSNDLILFSTPEFGYFTLPEEYCAGSSIMPQKRNPDPLELIRARSATVLAQMHRTLMILRNLPSGYNRDLQESKPPLMEGFDIADASLTVLRMIVEHLQVNRDTLTRACVPELFATDAALDLVQQGIPFRDAYRQVSQNLDALTARDPQDAIRARSHLGGPGNLGLDQLTSKIEHEREQIEREHHRLIAVKEKLTRGQGERETRGQGDRGTRG